MATWEGWAAPRAAAAAAAAVKTTAGVGTATGPTRVLPRERAWGLIEALRGDQDLNTIILVCAFSRMCTRLQFQAAKAGGQAEGFATLRSTRE
eukprot:9496138-Pyramimonas_sp.AAC.1